MIRERFCRSVFGAALRCEKRRMQVLFMVVCSAKMKFKHALKRNFSLVDSFETSVREDPFQLVRLFHEVEYQ